jgi:hypothetical protein
MKKFNEFYKEQTSVGLIELIDINGIGQYKAKVDSGNQGYNVIHGTNIEELPDNKVKFLTADNKTVSFKKHGDIDIHIGSSVEEKRPVILLNFKIGSQFYQNIPFSVADRSKNEEKVLIGEPFLKKIDAVIDVSKEQLHEARMLPLQDQLKETIQEMEGLYVKMEPIISELEELNSLPNVPFNKIAEYNKVLNFYYKELQDLKSKRDRLAYKITFGFQNIRKSML